MNHKENQFIDWLCGVKGVEFPFFKEEEMPQIEMPEKKEKTSWEKYKKENKSVPVGHFPHERDSSWSGY